MSGRLVAGRRQKEQRVSTEPRDALACAAEAVGRKRVRCLGASSALSASEVIASNADVVPLLHQPGLRRYARHEPIDRARLRISTRVSAIVGLVSV